MATSVTIDASKLHALIDGFDGAEEVVQREGHAALVRSAAAVEGDAKQNLTDIEAVDTGTLRRSVTTDVSPMEAAIGTNLSYPEVVEVGRGENKPPPPPDELLGWVRRHGFPDGMRFYIAKKIGRVGIPARPYLVPALTENEPAMNREFDIAADRALAELTR